MTQAEISLFISASYMPIATGNQFMAPLGNVGFNPSGNNDTQIANRVYAIRFYLPYKIVVNKISGVVTVVSAGGNAQLAIYNDSKTKLFESGNLSTASTGLVTATLGAPQTMLPGFYWCAYSFDNTVARMNGWGTNGNGFTNDQNQQGASPNAATSGVMPASLGTLTSNLNNGVLINITNY